MPGTWNVRRQRSMRCCSGMGLNVEGGSTMRCVVEIATEDTAAKVRQVIIDALDRYGLDVRKVTALADGYCLCACPDDSEVKGE